MSATRSRTRPLREFSFGYEVRDSHKEEVDGKSVRVLTDVEVLEVGPTLIGMNPATRLVTVKRGPGDVLHPRVALLMAQRPRLVL